MRDALDRYYTPRWVIDVLLEHLSRVVNGRPLAFKIQGKILEPCCGDGRLADALRAGLHRTVVTGDLDPAVTADHHWDFRVAVQRGDVMPGEYGAVITNPPYRDVSTYVEAALSVSRFVAMLMPITWQEPTSDRWCIWRDAPPHWVLVLPRPSFRGNGTDARTVAWYVWDGVCDRTELIVVDPQKRSAGRDVMKGQLSLMENEHGL